MRKIEHDTAVAELRKTLSTLDKSWYRSCSDLIEKRKLKGLECLDLCCGNGEYSEILRDRYQMNVTCSDYIGLHLKQLQKRGFSTINIDLDGGADVVDKVAATYAEKFDLVVNLAAIEHVFCSDNLLRFAHKVLKPDGLLIINTPNIAFLAYRIYSAISGNRPFGEGHHVRFWDFRFLRTNLFFNGFETIEDFRRFYMLPEEILKRGFKNLQPLAKFISLGFHLCRFAQHLPLFRGLATDELTLLCRKENVMPLGFNYLTIKQMIENKRDPDICAEALNRLKVARDRGWLKEHLYMTQLVEDNLNGFKQRSKNIG